MTTLDLSLGVGHYLGLTPSVNEPSVVLWDGNLVGLQMDNLQLVYFMTVTENTIKSSYKMTI